MPLVDDDVTRKQRNSLYEDDYENPRYAEDQVPQKQLEDADKISQARAELFKRGSTYKATMRTEIVGIDNVLVEIDEVIHWLVNSAAYQEHNARLEPGIIFEGPPGTGKTLVSRYIATAANSLFVNVRDFPIEGRTFKAQDVAELFQRARATYAKDQCPIVLFWDEFESGAPDRNNSTPEQQATVTQLLSELDGVHGKNEGIVLIGCTNYLYGVERALRRAGRMGLHIEFAPPDRLGKKLLLEHYLGVYKKKGEVDLETLAYFFDSDATAADIEEACVEAWRHAVRRTIGGKAKKRNPFLRQEDLVHIFLKRLVGPPTAFVNMPMEDRARVALHEVGHAIMALVYDIPLRLITVQPGKKALGRVITAEVREHIGTMDEWLATMRVMIGSIVAEQQGEVAALVGSTGDVKQVNEIAVKLVDNLYQGEYTKLFNIRAASGARAARSHQVSPNVADTSIEHSDRDVKALLDTTYEDGKSVMASIGKQKLWQLANAVNSHVTLTGQEFKLLFEATVGKNPAELRPSDK